MVSQIFIIPSWANSTTNKDVNSMLKYTVLQTGNNQISNLQCRWTLLSEQDVKALL